MTLPTRSAPAVSLPVSRRLTRAAVEFLPPMVVALLILPYIIQYGKLVPWHPSTIDLQVYVYAVKDMLAGRDIFATTTPFWNLYFIYPPIAAILKVEDRKFAFPGERSVTALAALLLEPQQLGYSASVRQADILRVVA